MNLLHEAAQQAVEALEEACEIVGAAWTWRDEKGRPSIDALRAALAQEQAEPVVPQAEPLNLSDRAVQRRLAAQWGYVPAEQAEPLTNQCGETCERAKLCAACARALDEPVQPVAWMFTDREGTEFFEQREDWDGWWTPLYTAPSRRTMVPLTEEEILAAVGWERAEMYMKLTPNFPVDEAKKETLKNARVVEKASWEKNHG